MSHPQGKWDIDPTGVNSVVSKTGGIAQGLEGQFTSYGTHLENAATHAGGLSEGGQGGQSGQGGKGSQPGGLVAVALSQFAEATKAQLTFIATRSGASLTGAVDATKAYLKGDLDMAAQAQQTALQGTTPPKAVLPPQEKK